MPRPHLFRTDSFAYHVTTRSNNKEWFYISSKKCWSIFKETLCATAERYGIYIHSLVLMSNHFHLLLSTPQKNLDISMQYFLSRSTQLIQNDAQQ
jgi:putative transposase